MHKPPNWLISVGASVSCGWLKETAWQIRSNALDKSHRRAGLALSARLCALLGNTSNQELIPFWTSCGTSEREGDDEVAAIRKAASCPRLRAPGVPA